MVGLVVTTKNEMYQLDYDAPHYDGIQKAVGGWYELVHPVGLKSPFCMMVNEEGLMNNLPMNLLGSYLYGSHFHGSPIVGDIVILKEGYYDGEPDVVGMTDSEAQGLGDKFITLSGGIVHWAQK